MAETVNKIRNADFSRGRPAPVHWQWRATAPGARWERGGNGPSGNAGGITIFTESAEGRTLWSQEVACKGGEFYRADVTLRCNLSGTGYTGFVLTVEPIVAGRRWERPWMTPALRRADGSVTIRAFFEAPSDVRRVRLSVGVIEASGRVDIETVRFTPILEPDAVSHILALPPPPSAHPQRCVAGGVCICSDAVDDRPISGLLAEYFGRSKVHTLSPAELRPDAVRADALLLPDPTPPPRIRSLAALKRLARDRIVVVSLPAFAALSGGAAMLRRIEQVDDPIHAKVTVADHATRGFALHDVFPYAWAGRAAGSFAQNQFRKTNTFAAFCHRHHFVTMMTSMCEREATSDQPICLQRPTEGGGLFVLDIEPVEASSSSLGEPTLAMHFLLSILGQTQASLGQFVVPARKEVQFRDLIRETAVRVEQFVVHDADVPADEVTEQLVTIGPEDGSYGPPLRPKPVILVRSGLTSGDVESAYGAFIWFKELVRPEPYLCPYAQALASQYRFAWIPSAARWEWGDGWRRSERRPSCTTIEMEGAKVAALIDLVSRPINRVRVVLARNDEFYGRCAVWLPRLFGAFKPGRYFALAVPEGDAFCDRSRFAWRRVQHNLEVVADETAFTDQAHRDALAAGGRVIRLELPGGDADFVANSIQRTDLAATLLEQVIGLQYGLIAVNRQAATVRFDGFPPVGPGKALIVIRDDPAQEAVSRVG